MVNMLLRASSILALVAAAAVLNGCREPTAERPTASQATSTAAPTVPPKATPTATASATPTPVPTHTATPSPTPTPTPTAAPPPAPTRTATATPSPLPTHTPTATPSPTPTATATPTPTPRPLTAAELFARVSPSIVFIESPTATGSGTLLRGGYVLTNAHVVGRSTGCASCYPTARSTLTFLSPAGTCWPTSHCSAPSRPRPRRSSS